MAEKKPQKFQPGYVSTVQISITTSLCFALNKTGITIRLIRTDT